jgi:uncharacterized protein YcfL
MARWFQILVLGALAALIAACATTGTQFPNVVVYGSQVQIERLNEHRLDAGELQAVVFGRSTASHLRQVRYRALWSDSSGRPIDTVLSAWSEMEIDGGRPFSMKFVGPGNRAEAYRIEIEVMERR